MSTDGGQTDRRTDTVKSILRLWGDNNDEDKVTDLVAVLPRKDTPP